MKIRVYHNGDDTFVAWKPDGFIDECRGFSLFRRRNTVEEVVNTWVGFEDDDHEEGERRASTNWPIQKYQWTDYMAQPGDVVSYRVVAMVGPDRHNLRADPTNASDWTEEKTLGAAPDKKIEVYFNRGIVAAQWVSRRLGDVDIDLQKRKLEKVIATPHDPMREYLMGPLGARLFELLDQAHEVYAALYELDDPQLEDALIKLGKKAHVVLANGSIKKTGDDQNKKARKRIAGKVDLHDRILKRGVLGHNKFLVVCDGNGAPRWVWTGSQNWTKTGLCTQANNSVLIDDPSLAREYRDQWKNLAAAGNETTDELVEKNQKRRDWKLGGKRNHLWFTPLENQVDLVEARGLIESAQHAVLFLMFNPGPRDSLLNQIIDTARAKSANRLYIKGAINQDPSTSKTPVELFDSKNWVSADYDVALPAAIDEPTRWFRREFKKLDSAFAMVHSKVVVVDPFSPNATVLTGSHNLGPKASGTNDENLLVIRDAPHIAEAYVANITSIYNQYRWRFRRQIQPKKKRWDGLVDSDTWQNHYKAGSAAAREVDFWVGD